MTHKEITAEIFEKKSFLCVGLDTDREKIPAHMRNRREPLFAFNREIIDATHDLCVAYKPNVAFYESCGTQGWEALGKTVAYIKEKYPKIFVIADAKRGDIGSTASMYAKAFFQDMNFDAVTLSPYMGQDSISPFLEYKNKWVILLALTSNKGAADFQLNREIMNRGVSYLYEQVIKTSREWGNKNNMMYVAGATRPEMLQRVREIVPDHFLLVPGIGAQGGSLEDVSKYGMTHTCGLLVNASRSIIYASGESDYARKSRDEAFRLQKQMSALLDKITS